MSIGEGLYWLGAFIAIAALLVFADFIPAAGAFAVAALNFSVLSKLSRRVRR